MRTALARNYFINLNICCCSADIAMPTLEEMPVQKYSTHLQLSQAAGHQNGLCQGPLRQLRMRMAGVDAEQAQYVALLAVVLLDLQSRVPSSV